MNIYPVSKAWVVMHFNVESTSFNNGADYDIARCKAWSINYRVWGDVMRLAEQQTASNTVLGKAVLKVENRAMVQHMMARSMSCSYVGSASFMYLRF